MSTLRLCGSLKRAYPEYSDSAIVLRGIREIIVPKLVVEDLILFSNIQAEVFPGVEIMEKDTTELSNRLRESCLALHLQFTDEFHKKCVDLDRTLEIRHSAMLLGPSFSGKTAILNCLAKANSVKVVTINAKGIEGSQLYGSYTPDGDWYDGILTKAFINFSNDTSKDMKWIVLDGPVDPEWIESLNTVMDDNKTLCLPTGNRIPLTPSMRVIFEIGDVNNATPATVSRNGMVSCYDISQVWKSFIMSYVDTLEAGIREAALDVLTWLAAPLVAYIEKGSKTCMPVCGAELVESMVNIFDSYVKQGALEGDLVNVGVFAAAWSFGAVVVEKEQFEGFLKEILFLSEIFSVSRDVKLLCRICPG